MKFSVTYNYQLSVEKQDLYSPKNWIMFLVPYTESSPAGHDVLTLEQVQNHQDSLWSQYEKMQTDKKEYFSNKTCRITQFIHPDFKDNHLSKIDFTMHLKDGIFLEKKEVIVSKNGRPVKSIYYHCGKKIAEIVFEFANDSDGYMISRVEKLGYYCVDDSVLAYYIISNEKFSGAITYQHQKRVAERTQARQFIMDSLRADIDRMLKAASGGNSVMAGALAGMINTFWVEYNPFIEAFISSGGTFLRQKFLDETKYPFLNSVIAPSVTVRMYIADKLTY